MGTLRLRLVQAGYRRDEALTIFFGIRVLFAVVLFLLLSSSMIIRPNTLVALGGLCMGYLLPGMVLARLAKRRAHRIRLSLADALDLLVVSVEAGLGLDQALTRVGTELAFAYPELADELKLINLELRAGKPRAEALRNLADRTGVDDLSSLVTMLIQTDKFGTSVAQSLRVYSETLRTKRRQRAEEAAAKTGVKMVFPLVLCIFPVDLGCDDRSGRHQVRDGAVPDGREHEEVTAMNTTLTAVEAPETVRCPGPTERAPGGAPRVKVPTPLPPPATIAEPGSTPRRSRSSC